MRWLLRSTLLVLAAACAVSAQSNSFAGTWKLNTEKSKLTSGPAAPVTMIITVSGEEETMKTVGNGRGNGSSGYVARYDAKYYPMKNWTTGQPTGVMTSLTRIDAKTVDRAEQRDGKVTSVTRRVLSADGRVMTSTTPGPDKDGKPAVSVRIWERQ